MKRIVAYIMTAVMVFSIAGCSDFRNGSDGAQSEESSQVTKAEESNESESAESAQDTSAEAQTTDSANTEDTSEVTDETAQTEGTTDADEASAAASQTGESETVQPEADYSPDDIVEPEIAEEEVTEPVEQPAEEAAQEESAEEDTTLDIVFMGDSQFDNARGTGSSIPEYTNSLLDNSRFYNLAIGGTAASLERGAATDPSVVKDSCFLGMCYALSGKQTDIAFLDKYPAGEELKKVDPAKVDVYVIEYGANDYINGKDLWNQDDIYDVHTYLGALNAGVSALKSVSPNAKFIMCGPSYCMWYNADGYVIGDSYTVSKGIGTLSDYSDTCSNFASGEGFTYIDTMYATWFDLKITTVDEYLSDGLHYKEKGRQIYAKTLAHFIKKTVGIDDDELQYMEINTFSFN